MTAIYRKRGSVTRWENGTLVRVTESGAAREEGDLFECWPEERPPIEAPRSDLAAIAASVRNAVPPGVAIERLILTEGAAEHELGDTRWRDETRRLHVSLTHGGVRALIDLGTFDVDEITRVAAVLARCDTAPRPAPPRLRLAPAVTAALLPSLAGLAPPNVTLLQTAGGVDGNGEPIVDVSIDTPVEREPWPNWYRPSYRVRPMRRPLNLRLECDVKEIDPSRPLAVALVAPVDGLVLRVLVDDGGRAYPAAVRITRIDAVGGARTWYPYGSGSFGAEMML